MLYQLSYYRIDDAKLQRFADTTKQLLHILQILKVDLSINLQKVYIVNFYLTRFSAVFNPSIAAVVIPPA